MCRMTGDQSPNSVFIVMALGIVLLIGWTSAPVIGSDVQTDSIGDLQPVFAAERQWIEREIREFKQRWHLTEEGYLLIQSETSKLRLVPRDGVLVYELPDYRTYLEMEHDQIIAVYRNDFWQSELRLQTDRVMVQYTMRF